MATPIQFEDARRENVWLRMMLMAPTGGGKTKGALEIASKLFDGGLPIVVIDSEHGRSKLYADRYRFKRADLIDDQSPEAWVSAIDVAEKNYPGGILILDSASHEWMGTHGVLQQADRFGEWKTVRPKHNRFVERILASQMHVICCVRSKMKYEVGEEEVNGRTRQQIRKLGLGPIQSDDFPYEFDVVAAIDPSTHDATFSNRCEPLVDTTRTLIPGDEVAAILSSWLSEGDPPPEPEEADAKDVDALVALLKAEGLADDVIEQGFAAARTRNRGKLHPEFVAEKTEAAKLRAAAKRTGKDPAPDVPAETPTEDAVMASTASTAGE